MAPVRVKICGLRRVEDAELCAELGADYLGCVLATDSPRSASLSQIRSIAEAVADRCPLVLVFRGAGSEAVLAAADATGVRRVQLHGSAPLSSELARAAGLRVHRVHTVPPDAALLPPVLPAPTADEPALFDVGRGGSGRRFPWRLLGRRGPAATFVGGGVDPENARELMVHRPFGVDVSSGVESAPGVKDPGRLRALFQALEVSA